MFGDLVNYFQQGGPVMWPLLVFSILTVTFIVERWLALRRAKINVNEFLSKVRKALLVNRDRLDEAANIISDVVVKMA